MAFEGNFPIIITPTPTCKVVLFQGGLNDNGTGFDTTIDLLMQSSDGSSKFIKYEQVLDMRNLNPVTHIFGTNTGDTSNMTHLISETHFHNVIEDIVDLGRANTEKIILVRTYLNRVYSTDIDLDTIGNQAFKLKYIIDEFSEYENVEIILVGHSQGGLVNLEAAIDRYSRISRIISISTPYSPVYLATVASLFDPILGCVTDVDNIEYYRACVNTLASNEYFNNLKSRWNALQSRPELTAIVGISGKLQYLSGELFDIVDISGFDGLVMTSEQTDIEHANFVYSINDDVPCYNNQLYASSCCTEFDNMCNNTCNLIKISFFDFFMKLLSDIWNEFVHSLDTESQNSSGETDSNSFLNIISNTAYSNNPNEAENIDTNDPYYNYLMVYANPNSHGIIRYNANTISKLIELFE